jgi:hypothetical protein
LNTVFHNKRDVWVPAFAGTTVTLISYLKISNLSRPSR